MNRRLVMTLGVLAIAVAAFAEEPAIRGKITVAVTALREDSFDRAIAGWEEEDDPEYQLRVENGAYRITVKKSDSSCMTTNDQIPLAAADILWESDLRLDSVKDECLWGLAWGDPTGKILCCFFINSGGQCQYAQETADEWQELSPWTPVPTLSASPKTTNRLAIKWIGGGVELFLNGELALRIPRAPKPAGEFGYLLQGTGRISVERTAWYRFAVTGADLSEADRNRPAAAYSDVRFTALEVPKGMEAYFGYRSLYRAALDRSRELAAASSFREAADVGLGPALRALQRLTPPQPLLESQLWGESALNCYKAGDFDRLVECSERRLAIEEKRGDQVALRNAVIDSARAYQFARRWDNARTMLEREIAMMAGSSDPAIILLAQRAAMELCTVYAHLHDYAAASSWADQARVLAGKARDPEAEKTADNWKATVGVLLFMEQAFSVPVKLYEEGKYLEAYSQFSALIASEDELKAKIGEYRLTDVIEEYAYATDSLCRLKMWAAAAAVAQKGLDRASALEPAYQRTLWHLLGRAREGEGKLSEAIAACERSAAGYATQGQPAPRRLLGFADADVLVHGGEDTLVASYLESLGWLYDKKGDKQKAGELLERSVALRGTILGDSQKTANIFFSLARKFLGFDDYAKAIEWFTRSLDMVKRISPRESKDLATVHAFLAEAYDNKGESKSAIENYRKALEIRLKILDPDDEDISITYSNLGVALYRAGQYGAAAENLERALAIDLRRVGEKDEAVIGLRIDLSSCYLSDGKVEQAVALASQAWQTIEGTGGRAHPLAPKCLNALGEAYHAKGLDPEAARAFDAALAAGLKAGGEKSPDVLKAYNNIGFLHLERGAPEKALLLFQKSLDINKAVFGEYHPNVGASYANIASALRAQGDVDQAMKYNEKDLAISIKNFGEDHPMTAKGYDDLAVACSSMGDFDGAARNVMHALEIDRRVLGEDHLELAPLYDHLAEVFGFKGEYEAALANGRRGMQIREKAYGSEHPAVAVSLDLLGLICNRKGDSEAAIAFHSRALEINRKSYGEDSRIFAKTLSSLGSAYVLGNMADKALERFRKALTIQIRVLGELHADVADTYNNIALAEATMKEYGAALEDFGHSLQISKALKGISQFNVAASLMNIARVKSEQGDQGNAIATQEQALSILKGTLLQAWIILGLGDLGLFSLRAGDATRARAALEEAISYIEKARGEAGSGKTSFMEQFFGVYLCALSAVASLKDTEAVYSAIERMKARGFLDELSLKVAAAAPGVDPGKGKRLIQLSDQIEALARRRSELLTKPAATQDPETIVLVGKELEKAEAEFQALDRSLMANPRYLALRQPRAASLKEAMGLCGKDTAILEYVIWERNPENPAFSIQRSYCLVITSGGARLVELDRDYKFGEAVERFRTATINGNVEAREKAAVELHARLIAPVAEAVGGARKLIIVPDGSLAFLPFDALQQEVKGPFLCERYQVSMSPSVSVLAMVRGRKWTGEKGAFLGMGGAQYEPGSAGQSRGRRGGIAQKEVSAASRGYQAKRSAKEGLGGYYRNLGIEWANLPGTRVEVEGIEREVYGGKGVKVILGEGVKEGEVKRLSKEGQLAKWKVVHFACHGYLDQEFPSLSAVVMGEVGEKGGSEDGYLSVEEVSVLRLEAELVNLSACETGLGKVVRGDGVVGLTRAFSIAGANRVGVTLWQVDDTATKEFMVGVYGKVVKKGMGWGEAWSEVKREFIRSGENADPFFWSPFVLYGE